MPTELKRAIARPADRCYQMFCNVTLLTAWVPGLKGAKVVRADPSGRPSEVLFAFGQKRSYTLVYRYAPAELQVDWTEGMARGEGVAGSARFAPSPAGCELTYRLELGERRSPEENLLGDPTSLVEAFARFMERGPA